MKKHILILSIFLLANRALAKSFDTYGAISLISLGKGISPKFDLNFQHYDTFNFTEKTFSGKKYPSRDQQAYFQTSLIYKFSPNLNLALGHIYQRNNPLDDDYTNEHRSFEQVTVSQLLRSITLTHRLRFEQRFINDQKEYQFKTRLRYQLGASLPLEGQQLDPGEWYVNSFNEFYFSTTGERNAFFSDDWLYAGIGYQTFDWGKIELGPMAQFSVVNRAKDIRNFYLIQLSWILKFK